MKTFNISLLWIVLLAGGCRQIVCWKHEIHQPCEEGPESLEKFLAQMGLTSKNVYLFKDAASFAYHIPNLALRHELIGMLVFDHHGLVQIQADTTSEGHGDIVAGLNNEAIFLTDTTFRWQQLISDLLPMNGKHEELNQSAFDYLVMITWACFAGKLNEPISKIMDSARQNRNTRISFVLLNVDMQKSWKLRKGQRLTFR